MYIHILLTHIFGLTSKDFIVVVPQFTYVYIFYKSFYVFACIHEDGYRRGVSDGLLNYLFLRKGKNSFLLNWKRNKILVYLLKQLKATLLSH